MNRFTKKNQGLDKALAKKINNIIVEHDNDNTQLIGILLDIQSVIERHYIPEEVSYYLSEKLDVPLSKIYDVISFYSSISDTPRAKYPIQVCNSIVCKVNDSTTLFETLRDILGIELNEVTYDGRFTLEKVPCFGACDIAPAIRINGIVYGNLNTREKIQNILNNLD